MIRSVSLTHLHRATEHGILTTGIPHTFLRNALYTDFVGVLGLDTALATGELRTYPGDWKFNTVTRHDLAIAIAAVLAGSGHLNRPVTFRQDPQIHNWIYGFLSQIDTSSTSADLETLIEGPATTLKDSLRAFITI
ncbi:hypothetical protein [Paenibacillus sp. SI8]|uniref:hypothetical protein n=1 Tax=unclassified Paenibacillus TaxID=185978 RepID=UPI00346784C7